MRWSAHLTGTAFCGDAVSLEEACPWTAASSFGAILDILEGSNSFSAFLLASASLPAARKLGVYSCSCPISHPHALLKHKMTQSWADTCFHSQQSTRSMHALCHLSVSCSKRSYLQGQLQLLPAAELQSSASCPSDASHSSSASTADIV